MLLLPYNTYTDLGFLFLKDTYPAVLYWKGTTLLHISEVHRLKVIQHTSRVQRYTFPCVRLTLHFYTTPTFVSSIYRYTCAYIRFDLNAHLSGILLIRYSCIHLYFLRHLYTVILPYVRFTGGNYTPFICRLCTRKTDFKCTSFVYFYMTMRPRTYPGRYMHATQTYTSPFLSIVAV
jgi:hypothetical protein